MDDSGANTDTVAFIRREQELFDYIMSRCSASWVLHARAQLLPSKLEIEPSQSEHLSQVFAEIGHAEWISSPLISLLFHIQTEAILFMCVASHLWQQIYLIIGVALIEQVTLLFRSY